MKILIIEDEVKLAAAIGSVLTMNGMTVDVIHDGEEGLSYALDNDYDLIITDWMLPQKTGPEIAVILREEKIITPILLLTALDQIKDRVLGLDSGADDYLTKPFAMDELLARVRALLRRPKTLPMSKYYEYEDLKIDFQEHSVMIKEKHVSLSNKEFSLLAFLLENQGIILSKEKIVAQIWNFETDILPSTVEVHMKNLRAKIAKIDADFGQDLIKTVRGHGYLISKLEKKC